MPGLGFGLGFWRGSGAAGPYVPPEPVPNSISANGTTDFLRYVLPAGILVPPVTFVMWWKPTAFGATLSLIGAYDGDSATSGFHRLNANATGAPQAASNDGSTASGTASAVAVAGTWCHAAARHSATNNRAGFLDGANKVIDTSTKSIAGLDRLSLFVRDTSTQAFFGSGLAAGIAAYDLALSDAEILTLAGGAHPTTVQGASLAFCLDAFDGALLESVSGLTPTAGTCSFSADMPPLLVMP